MFLSRRIDFPLYFLLLLLLALGLNLLRGFDLARRHNQQLVPRRVTTVLDLRAQPDSEFAVDAKQDYLLVHLSEQGDGSLELRQILSTKTLLRWGAERAAQGDWLVVPLAGLGNGEYGLCWSRPRKASPTQLEDELAENRDWVGRFTLH